MSITTTPLRVDEEVVAPLKVPTLGWALRRALLAILILSVFVTSTAWLLYASIDPDEENAPAAVSPAQVDHSLSTGHDPADPRHV